VVVYSAADCVLYCAFIDGDWLLTAMAGRGSISRQQAFPGNAIPSAGDIRITQRMRTAILTFSFRGACI